MKVYKIKSIKIKKGSAEAKPYFHGSGIPKHLLNQRQVLP